jgi:hypothetical protein
MGFRAVLLHISSGIRHRSTSFLESELFDRFRKRNGTRDAIRFVLFCCCAHVFVRSIIIIIIVHSRRYSVSTALSCAQTLCDADTSLWHPSERFVRM